jgi:hypothetical protein
VSAYALHPGADGYLRRDEPSFVSKYTDQLSLGLTVAAILWSGLTAINAWRRTRNKNRIDVFYEEARVIADDALAEPTEQGLAAARRKLMASQERAMTELSLERLDASEGFVILLLYVDSRLRELDRALQEQLPEEARREQG